MSDAHADLLGAPTDLLSAGEFAAPAVSTYNRQRGTTVVVLPPNPATMGEKYLKLHTQNKIRQAFHNLAINNLEAVQGWLYDVAKDSPSKAVELFLELAKFSLPQLKETAVTVTQNGSARTYRSSEELLQELNAPE